MTNGEIAAFIFKCGKKQKWTFLLIALLDAFSWPLDSLLWPYLLRLLVDLFTQFDGDRLNAWHALVPLMIAGVSLVLFVELAARFMGFLMANTLPKLIAEVRMKMFDHIQRHSPRYFNDRFAGNLANRISEMTSRVEVIIQMLFWPVIPAISAVILASLMLYQVSWILSMILLGWISLHLAICLLCSRSCDAQEHIHGEVQSTLMGRIVDSLTNNFAINLFYAFEREKQEIGSIQKQESEANQRSRRTVERMRSYTSLFYFTTFFLGMNAPLIYLWLYQGVSTGQIVMVMTITWNIGNIAWAVGSALPILFQSFGAVKQAYVPMTEAQDIGDLPDATPIAMYRGEIVFEGVHFQYGENQLFENKHVHIAGGEKVGLVGYSGAGKTSFLSLLMRFYSPSRGQILIDGQDIAKVTLESLRRQISMIPQEPLLFHRSLKENIAFGKPEASDQEIFIASKFAHCHEFIEKLPQGYQSIVGERGTKLSGGERQRVAIARAMLLDTPILLLDEATSALDSVTESYIQESLSRLMLNRTTLVIAHRLSTLLQMDRILVFENGSIVEEGTHTQLIEREGHYARMWKKQIGDFLPETSDK
ncbi:MAG: ABC transporter ATP-binding protein [Chlamydiia bacterium]|nr:ABC transporter ATP-binding protein [Chlamydiia bacterium]